MSRAATILVVDDEAALRRGLKKALEADGLEALTAADLAAARAALAERSPDALLLDLKLPDGSGFELLEELRRNQPELPVIILTAYGDVRSAVKAMRSGAWDFLEKPFELDVVLFTLERALERSRLRGEVRLLRERLDAVRPLGDSPAWRTALATARRVAPTTATLLLIGESGTGKEVLARHVHELSGREGDFVPVHAAALPAELLESELFGHARGAFSGAVRAKAGLFETAAGGTLFLDEVGELPAAVQVKLLRVLQEGVVTRLGETQPRDVDLRLVAATNSDLDAAVATGDFREDLYYRLAVLELVLPPLRERTGDVALLAAHFLKRAAAEYDVEPKRLTPAAERLLSAHPWPGNVRELNNLCQRLVLLAPGGEITPADLPHSFQRTDDAATADWPPPPPRSVDLTTAVERLERRLLERALAEADGVAQEAARRLGLGRGAMQYKLKKYGLGN
ncbi:MAG: response regulator [Candidatus Coatesbacteria bacterium]|nr:response regulator [Candidatus Coatesbacteria bacterium]